MRTQEVLFRNDGKAFIRDITDTEINAKTAIDIISGLNDSGLVAGHIATIPGDEAFPETRIGIAMPSRKTHVAFLLVSRKEVAINTTFSTHSGENGAAPYAYPIFNTTAGRVLSMTWRMPSWMRLTLAVPLASNLNPQSIVATSSSGVKPMLVCTVDTPSGRFCCRPPCPNVWADGRLCTGDADFRSIPDGSGLIKTGVRAFDILVNNSSWNGDLLTPAITLCAKRLLRWNITPDGFAQQDIGDYSDDYGLRGIALTSTVAEAVSDFIY